MAKGAVNIDPLSGIVGILDSLVPEGFVLYGH